MPLSSTQYHVICPVCGEYNIKVGEVRSFFHQLGVTGVTGDVDAQARRMSYWMRRRQDRGEAIELSMLPTEKEGAVTIPPIPDVPTRMDNVLLWIGKSQEDAAATLEIRPTFDWARIGAASPRDARWILHWLQKTELAEAKQQVVADPPTRPVFREVALTPKGWSRVKELSLPRNSRQIFVAMWFNDEVAEAFEKGIRPAIVEVGLEPQRIDFKDHNNKICDEIVAEIRRSVALIADFTGHRGGVYYEAGFAQGLGIPVIWTCREDAMDEAHFDTRQYAHITWKTPEELKDKLVNRMKATLPGLVRTT